MVHTQSDICRRGVKWVETVNLESGHEKRGKCLKEVGKEKCGMRLGGSGSKVRSTKPV